MIELDDDPSAGSPTETLLRLLPGSSHTDQDRFHLQVMLAHHKQSVPIFLEMAQFRAATGGVYKGQGRNQRKLMTCTY